MLCFVGAINLGGGQGAVHSGSMGFCWCRCVISQSLFLLSVCHLCLSPLFLSVSLRSFSLCLSPSVSLSFSLCLSPSVSLSESLSVSLAKSLQHCLIQSDLPVTAKSIIVLVRPWSAPPRSASDGLQSGLLPLSPPPAPLQSLSPHPIIIITITIIHYLFSLFT
jgi:hypothetical protein